ncbi:hypothetical protein H0H92_001899 [Tricholoma furcatifolium]|nr:hypothetical protein H0H92_001899 [Tricholoma furcatifolium]
MDPGDEEKYPSTPNEKTTVLSESYEIGVHETIGHRPSMEDSYGFVVDFHAIRGQGLFAIFDGHGNKLTAEWAGGEFHKHLLKAISDKPKAPIEDVFKDMFDSMDQALSKRSVESANWAASGCTAAVAFLRFEDKYIEEKVDWNTPHAQDKGGGQEKDSGKNIPESERQNGPKVKTDPRAQSFAPARSSALLDYYAPNKPTPDFPPPHIPYTNPPADARRVLYTANAGDSRIVLSRGGIAERLTYDHKVSDPQEIKRVKDLRGVFWRGRVLGQLNITRGLGDHEAQQGYSIKKFVVSTPYTKRVELNDDDNFIILACDGVWDVLSDQEAVDHIQHVEDPKIASKMLLDLAMEKETRDNVTVMVVRLKPRKY